MKNFISFIKEMFHHNKMPLKPMLWGGLCVVAIWLIWLVLTLSLRLNSGNSFTALNALFSGLAFIGIAITIYIQYNELKGIEEKSSFQQQVEIQYQFERFFILLLEELKSDRTLNNAGAFYILNTFFDKSDECKHFLNNIYRRYINRNLRDEEFNAIKIINEKLYKSAYSQFLKRFQSIYEYINDSSNVNKEFYFNILFNSISTNEAAIIFINFLNENENRLLEKFLPSFYNLLSEPIE